MIQNISRSRKGYLNNVLIDIDDIVTDKITLDLDLQIGSLTIKPENSGAGNDRTPKITYLFEPDGNDHLIIHALHGVYSEKHPGDIAAFYKIRIIDSEIIEFNKYIQHEQTIIVNGKERRTVTSRLHQHLPTINKEIIEKCILLNKVFSRIIDSSYQGEVIVDSKNKLFLKGLTIRTPEILQDEKFSKRTESKTSQLSHKGIASGPVYLVNKNTRTHSIPRNSVLVINSHSNYFLHEYKRAKAIILNTNEITVQQLLAKEIFKPIVAVKKSEHSLKNKDFVFVDSNTGKITKLDKTISAVSKTIQFDESHKDSHGGTLLNTNKVVSMIKKLEDTSEHNLSKRIAEHIVDTLKITSEKTFFYSLTAQGLSHDVLISEIKAVKLLLEEYKFKRIILIAPPIKNSEELLELKRLLHKAHITRSPRLQIYLRISLPTQIVVIESFFDEQIDGLLFDWEQLTKYTYGFEKNVNKEKFNDLANSELIFQLLDTCVTLSRRRNCSIYTLLPESISESTKNKIMEKGVNGLIFSE